MGKIWVLTNSFVRSNTGVDIQNTYENGCTLYYDYAEASAAFREKIREETEKHSVAGNFHEGIKNKINDQIQCLNINEEYEEYRGIHAAFEFIEAVISGKDAKDRLNGIHPFSMLGCCDLKTEITDGLVSVSLSQDYMFADDEEFPVLETNSIDMSDSSRDYYFRIEDCFDEGQDYSRICINLYSR